VALFDTTTIHAIAAVDRALATVGDKLIGWELTKRPLWNQNHRFATTSTRSCSQKKMSRREFSPAQEPRRWTQKAVTCTRFRIAMSRPLWGGGRTLRVDIQSPKSHAAGARIAISSVRDPNMVCDEKDFEIVVVAQGEKQDLAWVAWFASIPKIGTLLFDKRKLRWMTGLGIDSESIHRNIRLQ
jgi:hypothetical protein